MRGLIGTPEVALTGEESVAFGTKYDKQKLRSWILYWDKIVSPEPIGVFGFSNDADLSFLESEGRFERLRRPHAGGEVSRMFIDARMQAFKELEGSSPGSWAIGSQPGYWDGAEAHSQRALRVHLMSALPVPESEVPLAEILEFCQKRQPERDALMAHIDEVYQSVIAAPDRPLAEHTALQKLAADAKSHLDIMSETTFPFRLVDIAADFNLVGAAATALTSVGLGSTWPQVVGNSLVAGGSVSVGKLLGLVNPKKTDTPFRYVLQYHADVFRPE